MTVTRCRNESISVTAYPGDAKTLLAFDLVDDAKRERLAGFTVEVRPPHRRGYFADNNLRLAPSAAHARIALESPFASVNAPIQSFRWIHTVGLVHQNGAPVFGRYTYAVTPRYFSDDGALLAYDPSTAVSVDVEVAPFTAGALKLGFTRGHVHSQAFARRFGATSAIRPSSEDLFFDTGAVAGTDTHGDAHTYAEQNRWLGATARQRVFEVLDEVRADASLRLDVYTCELDEPDVCVALLTLGATGRVRITLSDNPCDDVGEPSSADRFAAVLAARAGSQVLRRTGAEGAAHRTFMIVSDAEGPRSVLTSSAGLSVAGLYVETNHVLVLDDRPVAGVFADVFGAVWRDSSPDSRCDENYGATTPFDSTDRHHDAAGVLIDFSPHRCTIGGGAPDRVLTRVDVRGALSVGTHAGHRDDAPLSAPFAEVTRPPGRALDHRFRVCGFGGAHPVVSCGNLAPRSATSARGGDALVIRDQDVAAAFVIEALQLDDYRRFVSRLSGTAEVSVQTLVAHPDKRTVAAASGWFLQTTDAWTDPHFDECDPRHGQRKLFAH